MRVTYKEISDYLEKSEQTIKNWKREHPQLLEFAKLGAISKKYNIDINDLKECLEIKELLEDTNISNKQLKELLNAVKGCKNGK